MDIVAFQNRMEELETGMKELRLDYDLDQNIGFKLEELRDQTNILTKDQDFFRQMSVNAIAKRDHLTSTRIDLLIKADIFFNEENYEKLKKDPQYRKINRELEKCQEEIDVASRYRLQADEKKYKIMKQIERLECREMQYNYQPFI